jgi:serine/threonine protein kinase
MQRVDLQHEARRRQGTTLSASNGRQYRFHGTSAVLQCPNGSEGLVQFAVDVATGVECCVKCFWDPSADRRKRSLLLAHQQLANPQKYAADALAGAPYEVIEQLGPCTPFAVLMKKVRGDSWNLLKERVSLSATFPPQPWPSLRVRATWAYGLATAIQLLEKHQFVHADLSEGNVMLTEAEPLAGDMALVDFDAFVHPAHPELNLDVRGSEGYAAPEIWEGRAVGVGSDRLGLAILIQEFLIVGEPSIDRDNSLGWKYDQESEICLRRGEPHPYLTSRFPELAQLVEESLRAVRPLDRPAPGKWRDALRLIAKGLPPRKRLTGIVMRTLPPATQDHVAFGDKDRALDLRRTRLQIRATLERNTDGSVDAIIYSGGQLNAQNIDGVSAWRAFRGPARIPLRPGVVMFDPKGQFKIVVEGRES